MMEELQDPAMALLFLLHLAGFLLLYLRRRQPHYLRLCALFGALVVYYVMGWLGWEPKLGELEVRSGVRFFAWGMMGLSIVHYVRRFLGSAPS